MSEHDTKPAPGSSPYGLPTRHPDPDGWRGHSLRLAAQIRELEERVAVASRQAIELDAANEALAQQLRYAIDALEGRPWTGWSTDDARGVLDG